MPIQRDTNQQSRGALLPFRSDIEEPNRSPEIVDVREGGQIIEALSSETAREIFIELYRKPGTTSDIADKIDTSIQNTSYHLRRFREAGLVSVIGTWYSSRGVEMDVYGPTKEPLVLIAGERSSKRVVTETLTDLAGSEQTTES